MPKRLTVVGATGNQGSSVVEAVLKAREQWTIRAITRNPSSGAAQALKARGVEIVKADLADVASLKTAFDDSQSIFAVTDFFVPFMAFGGDATKAVETERTQVLNIIEAASATTALQHFIWSTLPHASGISGDRYHIPHFLAKNFAEDRIKTDAALHAKTSFLWVGWYSSNFLYPMFKPALLEPAGRHIQVVPAPADVPVPCIGDPQVNVGKFALAILQHPEKTLPGLYIDGSIAKTTFGGLLEAWSEVTGKESVYLQISVEEYDRLWPGWGAAEGEMFRYYEAFRERSWSVDGLVSANDLGVEVDGMEGVKAGIRKAEA